MKNVKIYLKTLALSIFTTSLFAQTNIVPKHRIGVQVSPFSTFDVITFKSRDGKGGFAEKSSQNFALTYEKAIRESLVLETGINYGVHKAFSKPLIMDGGSSKLFKEKKEIISVPVLAKYYWGNYFFVNGGPVIDIDITGKTNIDNQSGIGLVAGLGAKYDFNDKYSLQINPLLNLHSLIPFTSSKYQEHILETGLKIGFYYNLSDKI